jgi:hypothetical protein
MARRIEMSEFETEAPAFGTALLLHRQMSVDEKAIFPRRDARRLMRASST